MPIPVGPIFRDDVSAPFFDGTSHGQLLLRRSGARATWLSPYAQVCPVTGNTDLSWEPASGGAKVISWTILTRKLPDGSLARGVFVIAELDEGPWWWSQVIDADPDAPPQEHQRLRIDFQRHSESEAIPVFRLA
jgi:uncharacterized protein